MIDETEVYWIGEVLPRCQLSGRAITDQFVDGRLPGDSAWGCLHPATFAERGGTFGAGCGQLYERQANGRWLKVEG